MTMLSASGLVCAMMLLSGTVAVPETQPMDDQTAENQLVKRSFCPHGWYQFNGRCFVYVRTPMSWAKAEKNCHRLRGNLASVRNFAEYRMIQTLIRVATSSDPLTWIGGTDAQEEKHWFWSDGTPFLYTNWCCGEPNNLNGNQHCLIVNHSGGKCWDDLSCSSSKPSVCVKKM